ncbi:MAG: Serine/threonine-protein kinase transcriptional regulatory protein PknK 3 [Geminicoccaceae bacterium]|nr:Serine/threonine-protein kinase transcriptional regulatory protein PknK 3 [Geminicoccaceae bacterium]
MQAVAAICRQLHGLPLAIELAAARSKLLPLAALLQRPERWLPLLTSGAREAPARQRTLRDTMAWSYELLRPDEQRLFHRLGVFASGWTLEAAEDVTNPDGDLDVLEGLASLVDKSLIRQGDEMQGEPRFGMYRWHVMDPIRFTEKLRVTIQAVGWRSPLKEQKRYLPLQDDIASTALWYQTEPHATFPVMPDLNGLEVV